MSPRHVLYHQSSQVPTVMELKTNMSTTTFNNKLLQIRGQNKLTAEEITYFSAVAQNSKLNVSFSTTRYIGYVLMDLCRFR